MQQIKVDSLGKRANKMTLFQFGIALVFLLLFLNRLDALV